MDFIEEEDVESTIIIIVEIQVITVDIIVCVKVDLEEAEDLEEDLLCQQEDVRHLEEEE